MPMAEITDSFIDGQITKYEYLDLVLKCEMYYNFNRLLQVLEHMDTNI